MAGFMAGFGSAFSQSFENAAQQRANREDDLFKIKFKSYQDQRTKYDEMKSKDSQNVKLAKSMMEGTATPEAWPKVYEWLGSGMTPAQVQDRIENGVFDIRPSVEAQANVNAQGETDDPSVSQDISQAASGAVDAQMAAAGMPAPNGPGIFGPNVSADAPRPGDVNEGPVDGGSMFGGLKMPHRTTEDERINNRVSKAAGVSTEELSKGIKYDPEPLPGMEGKSVMYKPKPKELDLSKIDTEQEILAHLVDAEQRLVRGDASAQADVDKYNQYLSRFKTLEDMQVTRAARAKAEAEGSLYTPSSATRKDTQSIVERSEDGTGWVDSKTGEVLQDDDVVPHSKAMLDYLDKTTEKLAKPIDEYQKGVEGLGQTVRNFNEVDQILTENPNSLTRAATFSQIVDGLRRDVGGFLELGASNDAQLDKIEQDITERYQVAGAIEKLALARSLIDAKVTRIVYNQLRSQGVDGRSVSIPEFQNTLEGVMAGGNEAGFRQGLREAILSEYDRLNTLQKNINEHSVGLQGFKNRFKIDNPYPPAPDVDTLLGDNAATLTKFREGTVDKNAASSKNGDENMPPAPAGVSEEDWPSIWSAMPEEDKALWQN